MDETNTEIALLKQCTSAMQKQLDSIEKKVDSIINIMENKYVTKEQFSTVRNIVYGMVATILLAVMGGIMTLLLK